MKKIILMAILLASFNQFKSQTTQGNPVVLGTNTNTGLGPSFGVGPPPHAVFELDVQGHTNAIGGGTGFTSENFGRGIRLMTGQATNRGSALVFDRGTRSNSYFIVGPHAFPSNSGDYYTGLSSALDMSVAPFYISRIDGAHCEGGTSSTPGPYAPSDPRRGHTQYFRDIYLFNSGVNSANVDGPSCGPDPNNIIVGINSDCSGPRLGIGVMENNTTANLHVSGAIRFENLDCNGLSFTPTSMLVTNDQGYVRSQPISITGNTNSCTTIGFLPRTNNVNGNMNCSQVYDNGTLVGIGNTTPCQKLDVSGNINADGSYYSTLDGICKRILHQQDDAIFGTLGVGSDAGISGDYNTFLGSKSGQNISTNSNFNTFVGYASGNANTTGYRNSIVGAFSGYNLTTGVQNTLVGFYAGLPLTTGNKNVFIGDESGTFSGNNSASNIAIGCTWGSQPPGPIGDHVNTVAIGGAAMINSDNTHRYGNCQVLRWGFGAEAPLNHAIHVGCSSANGNGAYLSAGGVWTDISNKDLKEDIQTLNPKEILQSISELEITKWKYIGTQDEYHIGPMAQDFQRLFKIGDGNSIAAGDKASIALFGVQALNNLIVEQQLMIDERNNQVEELSNKVSQLEIALSQCCTSFSNLSNANSSTNTQPKLEQNTPNPFSEKTTIRYYIPESTVKANINIYTLDGDLRQSINLTNKGFSQIEFDGNTFSNGTYLYTLIVDNKQVESKIMILTK